MLTFGDIHVHLIVDAFVRSDPGGMFGLVPRVLWQRYYQPDENHLVQTSLNCLLIQADSKNVLVDNGLGTRLDEKAIQRWQLTRPNGDIVAALSRLDLTPDDIDVVVNTHLHSDHCAGNTGFDADGNIVPMYPNAVHYVQRREYEDASNPNERTRATYFTENWQVLEERGQLQLLDGDTEFTPGVYGVVTPGHTPGHMSVRIEGGGQHLLFACDMVSLAVHFERLAWMTAFDVEPLVTLETKRAWQRWALENDAAIVVPHDAQRPIGKLREDDGRVIFEYIDETPV